MVKEKISILIPAFNEEDKIILTIKETLNVFEKIGYDYEIVIIDDGSVDNTYNIVQENLNIFNERVKIERYKSNTGKGFAIKYGFNFVSGDYVLFLDADLDLHPSQITNFLKLMKEHKADFVMGSKRHKDSIVDYPKSRKFLSTGYYFLIKILFGLPVKDTQTGFKLFRYEALKNGISRIIVKRYAFDLELLVVLHKLGYKIIECPIYLKPSRRYYNRIGLKDIYHTLIDTAAIFYRLKIKRFYD
jgi:Glycosyltransferases, probably involved in cell wall biogenesis